MKVNRVETQIIRKSHPMWKVVDENCLYSKNLYNYATYIIRQEFINNGNWLHYQDLQKMLKDTEPYKTLMSQPSQCVLQMIDRSWRSYFVAIKDWKNNKEKYLGIPKMPNYKNKNGRYVWTIKNNSCYFNKNGCIYFRVARLQGYNWKTQANGRLICVRFVPIGTNYKMEVVTEIEVPNIINIKPKSVISIDLGINNFATITNNIGLNPIIINGKGIKSINQFYNKQRANLQSDIMRRNKKHWSNKLEGITFKRNNIVKNFIHNASSYIIKYCTQNNIDTIACGYNKGWKQESKLGSKNNQHFIGIPYLMFVKQLEYKCENVGIKFIVHEESYTSGTSFLDGETPCKENYDKSRRIQRGLFQNINSLINSDVNGSLQIMRKVFSNAISYEIEGVLNPIVINVVNFTA